MNDRSFDTLSRRASLLTLGAGLAALSPRQGSATEPRHRKRKKHKERTCNKKKQCKEVLIGQAEDCRAFEESICEVFIPQVCEARLACCSVLKRGRTIEYLDCLQKASNPIPAR